MITVRIIYLKHQTHPDNSRSTVRYLHYEKDMGIETKKISDLPLPCHTYIRE